MSVEDGIRYRYLPRKRWFSQESKDQNRRRRVRQTHPQTVFDCYQGRTKRRRRVKIMTLFVSSNEDIGKNNPYNN